ncbi:unnamed protein product, partial [Polarella glacialis]
MSDVPPLKVLPPWASHACPPAVASLHSPLNLVRFTYETVFMGQVQEGSGEAIHLAASRGHVEVVKLLMQARAELSTTVSRSGKNHYDVLHAAMFAEGRGGSQDMISHLFEVKAEMSKNLDGKYPLHVAFQTGNVPVITLLRTFLAAAGVNDEDYKDPKVALPLEMGISAGKMSEEQLSEAAELTTHTLSTFIHNCPQCIPTFLDRLEKETSVKAVDLAKNLTRFDVATVLRESPTAACALLAHTTSEPECENRGWHPLPSRVSFANRSMLEEFRSMFNPPKSSITFYEKDHVWSFDSQTFQAPEWHNTLIDRSYGRPIIDADIRVCHIPDIICAEVFAALCDDVNDDVPEILHNDDVIDAAVTHTFWNGCSKVDMTQVMLGIWGLVLLLLENWYVKNLAEPVEQIDEDAISKTPDRLLLRGAGTTGGNNNLFSFLPQKAVQREDLWISISFIAAKGVIDFLQEVVQFLGFRSI